MVDVQGGGYTLWHVVSYFFDTNKAKLVHVRAGKSHVYEDGTVNVHLPAVSPFIDYHRVPADHDVRWTVAGPPRRELHPHEVAQRLNRVFLPPDVKKVIKKVLITVGAWGSVDLVKFKNVLTEEYDTLSWLFDGLELTPTQWELIRAGYGRGALRSFDEFALQTRLMGMRVTVDTDVLIPVPGLGPPDPVLYSHVHGDTEGGRARFFVDCVFSSVPTPSAPPTSRRVDKIHPGTLTVGVAECISSNAHWNLALRAEYIQQHGLAPGVGAGNTYYRRWDDVVRVEEFRAARALDTHASVYTFTYTRDEAPLGMIASFLNTFPAHAVIGVYTASGRSRDVAFPVVTALSYAGVLNKKKLIPAPLAAARHLKEGIHVVLDLHTWGTRDVLYFLSQVRPTTSVILAGDRDAVTWATAPLVHALLCAPPDWAAFTDGATEYAARGCVATELDPLFYALDSYVDPGRGAGVAPAPAPVPVPVPAFIDRDAVPDDLDEEDILDMLDPLTLWRQMLSATTMTLDSVRPRLRAYDASSIVSEPNDYSKPVLLVSSVDSMRGLLYRTMTSHLVFVRTVPEIEPLQSALPTDIVRGATVIFDPAPVAGVRPCPDTGPDTDPDTLGLVLGHKCGRRSTLLRYGSDISRLGSATSATICNAAPIARRDVWALTSPPRVDVDVVLLVLSGDMNGNDILLASSFARVGLVLVGRVALLDSVFRPPPRPRVSLF